MPVPKGYRHSPEARAAISASMSKCWQEGRRQWQKDTPNRYQKLDAQQRSGELTEAMVVQAEVDAKASDNAEALAFSCRTED